MSIKNQKMMIKSVLFLAVNVGFVVPVVTGDCVSQLTQISSAELGVTDVSALRIYNLCPNTTFPIGPQAQDLPLAITKPNVLILCGDDGDSENSCVVEGGEVAQFFIEGNAINKYFVDNVTVTGVTFARVETNYNVYGQYPGIITFRDCVFKENKNEAAVMLDVPDDDMALHPAGLKITLDSCLFEDNDGTFADAVNVQLAGLVQNFGQTVVVNNSTFQNNNVSGVAFMGEISGLIGNFEKGDLTVTESCFSHNQLAIAPILNDGGTAVLSRNAGEQNERPIPDGGCDFALNVTSGSLLENPSAISASCIDFDVAACPGEEASPSPPSAVPSSGPTVSPTSRPSAVPSSKPTDSPTSRPSAVPSSKPTDAPSGSQPSAVPSSKPSSFTDPGTGMPSAFPSSSLTLLPSAVPSASPTLLPSAVPTTSPTRVPTPKSSASFRIGAVPPTLVLLGIVASVALAR